jgi:hypothetical protein
MFPFGFCAHGAGINNGAALPPNKVALCGGLGGARGGITAGLDPQNLVRRQTAREL